MFERKPAGIFWVWFQASPWILVAKEGKLDTSTSLLFLRLPFGTETSLWHQLWHPLSQGNSKRPLGSCRLACEWFPDSVVAATKNAAMTVVDQGDARSFSCKSTKKKQQKIAHGCSCLSDQNEDTVHAERKPGPGCSENVSAQSWSWARYSSASGYIPIYPFAELRTSLLFPGLLKPANLVETTTD